VSGGPSDRDRVPVWEELERPAPDSATVAGVELRKGSRVLLAPQAGRDVLDLVLAGKVAIVEGIDQDYEDNIHLAVTIEDDPGRDLGEERQPGHRFFFALDEVEPLDEERHAGPATKRVLVAGIGNVFLGDDGFGVEAATRLAARKARPGVEVVDFGIRGMDLAYALQDGYDAAIFIDATPRGDAPGTLYVIEPELEDDGDVALEGHGMDPVKVLALARTLGRLPERVLVVGCEPRTSMSIEDPDLLMELSEPVRAAIDGAVGLVESLLEEIMASEPSDERTVQRP